MSANVGVKTEAVLKWRKKGWPLADLAKKFKVTKVAILYHLRKAKKDAVRVRKSGGYGWVKTTGYASVRGCTAKEIPLVGITLEDKAKMDGKPWVETAKALRAKAVEFIECAANLEKLANGGGGL